MLALSTQNLTLSPQNRLEQLQQEALSEKFVYLNPIIAEAKKAIAESSSQSAFGSSDILSRFKNFLIKIGNFKEALENANEISRYLIMKIGKQLLKFGNALEAVDKADLIEDKHNRQHYKLYIAYKRAKYGDVEGAKIMLQELREESVETNLREYLIRLYATLGQFDEAKKIDLELPSHYPFPQYRSSTYLVIARARSGDLEGAKNELTVFKEEMYSQLKIHLERVMMSDIHELLEFLSNPSKTIHHKYQHYLISKLRDAMLKIKENLIVYKKLPSLSDQVFGDYENASKYFKMEEIGRCYNREPKREELISDQYYEEAIKEIVDLKGQISSQVKKDCSSNGLLVESETPLKCVASVQIKIQDFVGALETISCYPHISCLSNRYQSELYVKLGEAQFKAGKIADAYKTITLIKDEHERHKLIYIIENKQKITPYWNCTSYWWNGNDRLSMPCYRFWHTKLADYANKDLSQIFKNKELHRNIKVKHIALKIFAAARIQERDMERALAAIDCIDSPEGRASVLVELLEEQLIN